MISPSTTEKHPKGKGKADTSETWCVIFLTTIALQLHCLNHIHKSETNDLNIVETESSRILVCLRLWYPRKHDPVSLGRNDGAHDEATVSGTPLDKTTKFVSSCWKNGSPFVAVGYLTHTKGLWLRWCCSWNRR